ncbi:MAG: permease [Pseudomonadota bacterium]
MTGCCGDQTGSGLDSKAPSLGQDAGPACDIACGEALVARSDLSNSGCCAAPTSDETAVPTSSEESSCCAPKKQFDWMLWGSVSTVALAVVYSLLFLDHAAHGPDAAVLSRDGLAPALGTFAHAITELLGKIWWGLALGVVFVGVLSGVPRDLVISVLGREAGFGGLLRATLAGVLLDMCSHGILAVGMKLYERGASIGQVIAFLLASPWNSFSLTLILFGLIGISWTLVFIGLSLVVGLLSGAIFDHLVARGRLPGNPWRNIEQPIASTGELWAGYRGGWQFSAIGLRNLLLEGLRGSRIVVRWAFFGLIIAAAIRAFVSVESYSTWFGASVAGLWLTLLAATVIEVCSEGATPIAADLMNRAAAPGNSFTFLMAGVATDYTELMSLRDTTSSWRIALFLPAVAVPQILLLGFILNQFST